MTQIATVVLQDAAGVNHSFSPQAITNGVAALVESAGVPIGNKQLTLSVTKTANGRYKTVIKLAVPVTQDVVVNGISQPTVVRTAYADITYSYAGTSNEQERKDLNALMVNALLDTTVFRPAVEKLSAPY
jgi:hypothetical protein